jgi:Spy/CpxP family protein refolding chaperone
MIKQKLLALFASVLTLTTLPMAVPAIAQSTPTPTPTGVTEILKQLNLTPEQQKRVDEIQALAAVQIKSVLTPEQLAQLKVLAEAGKGDAESFNALNLTDAQKAKLNEVKVDIALQLMPVLSSEQLKKLSESVAGPKSQ